MARYFSMMVWIYKSTASQRTIYVQHNFSPFEFHSLQSLTKAGDTVQFFFILVSTESCFVYFSCLMPVLYILHLFSVFQLFDACFIYFTPIFCISAV